MRAALAGLLVWATADVQAATLIGVVADSDIYHGTRLVNADVWIPSTGQATVSDGSGIYQFTVSPGSYTVHATAPGYTEETCTKVVDSDSGDWWCSIAVFPAADTDTDTDADSDTDTDTDTDTDADTDTDTDTDTDADSDTDTDTDADADADADADTEETGLEVYEPGDQSGDWTSEYDDMGCSCDASGAGIAWTGVLGLALIRRRRGP